MPKLGFRDCAYPSVRRPESRLFKVGARLAALCILFSTLWCVPAIAQMRTITGTVLSSIDASPLEGVSVTVEGTERGTTTDAAGQFSIQASTGQVLRLSYLGFQDGLVTIGNSNTISFTLESADSRLNEVVVVGYGQQRRKDLTGAIASVKTEQLENERPQSVQDVLRGNVAGLAVGFAARASGNADLELRGDNSLKTSSSPLIVLDGVIYPGVLSDINPNDIESIDVLKDASSSAIFGARAANGVIQITTKKGKSLDGKAQINFNSSVGLATMATLQKVYGPHEFLQWRRDVVRTMNYYNTSVNQKLYIYDDPRNLPAGITIDQWRDGNTSSDPMEIWLSRLGLSTIERQNFFNNTPTDWEDLMYRNGLRQDHNVSISGKTSNFSYYMSLGYNRNEGVIVGDDFETLRARVNLDAKITDWLNVGTTTQFARRDESNIVGTWGDVYRASPWGSYLTDDGTKLRLSPTDDLVGSKNPLYDREYQDRLRDFTTIISTLYANVKLPFGINYRLNFSPRFEFMRHFNHQMAIHEEWSRFGGGAERQNQTIESWQLDNLITWNRQFGDHRLEFTGLINAEKYQSWFNSMSTQGFSPTDALGYHNMASGNSLSNVLTSNDEYSTGDALMGRIFYSYLDRYMVTLSLRRDGYSAFGLENPRATFPAVALGWVFSEEKFMENNNFLTYGKLRLSWGENGNREIGRYDAFSDMGIGKYAYYTLNGQLYESNQLFVNRMSNPRLRWEKSEAYNAGVDFSIKNGLIDGSVDFYRMRTLDLLVDRKLPDIVGFTSVTSNLGSVQNTGFELNLSSRVMDRTNLKWNVGFNFTLNRNKILSLYGDMIDILDENGNKIGEREADDITNRWFIGKAIDVIWDPVILGVWQFGQEAEAADYGQQPGDFRLKDVDGSGNIDQLDYEFQGYREPRFRWNLRNDFTILKNITFSFNLYSYWGHKATYNVARNSDGFPERNNAYVTPYWTPENPLNDYSRIRSLAGGVSFNVWRYRSFIRLDNVSIGYNIPSAVLGRTGISSLRVFGTIRNTAFWAPEWKFWDPEISEPNPRYFTFGINMTL